MYLPFSSTLSVFTVAFANAEKKAFCVSDAHLLEVTEGQIKAHVLSSRVESCYATDVIWMPLETRCSCYNVLLNLSDTA